MAHLNRFTVDLVTEEPLSPRRMEGLSMEISSWLHTVGVESDDKPISVTDKFCNGHEHDTTSDRCRSCNYLANDSKNGESLV